MRRVLFGTSFSVTRAMLRRAYKEDRTISLNATASDVFESINEIQERIVDTRFRAIAENERPCSERNDRNVIIRYTTECVTFGREQTTITKLYIVMKIPRREIGEIRFEQSASKRRAEFGGGDGPSENDFHAGKSSGRDRRVRYF